MLLSISDNLDLDKLSELKRNSIDKINKEFTWDIVIKDFINKIDAICLK